MTSSETDLTRRQLLISGAAAAGYALAVRPVAASTIQTDPEGLVHGMVAIPTAAGEIEAFRAHPAPGADGAPGGAASPFPVVLVVHEIFGVHTYIRDVCLRLAREGYLAVAPNLYQRHGDVASLANIDAIIEKVVKRVPDAQVMADLDAAVAWAEKSGEGDVSRLAITGFCWGGRIVWLYAAHSPTLRAGAAWYGRLEGAERPETPKHPLDLVDDLRAPVLGLYGSEDPGIPLAEVMEMRGRLVKSGKASEIIVFPAAGHGFHADYRPSYRSMAASEGWRRMLGWFRMNGVR